MRRLRPHVPAGRESKLLYYVGIGDGNKARLTKRLCVHCLAMRSDYVV